ncbi:hypothetical protein M0811_11052 [Anaeramoeba ignava]|uniref:Uncharacterized protein n=1 Tax=Anaeramoeba ignava TaxID=1746090 RepID=A0A9Q0LC33_ANAIG|nr:hypothetical protein M0811_11052 [Anaeramoeba ignava]
MLVIQLDKKVVTIAVVVPIGTIIIIVERNRKPRTINTTIHQATNQIANWIGLFPISDEDEEKESLNPIFTDSIIDSDINSDIDSKTWQMLLEQIY